MSMIKQLPFDLHSKPSYGRDDLMVGDANFTAIGLIDEYPNWPNPVLVLSGPSGSGKTHIAQYWAELSGATELCANFSQSDIPQSSSVLIENVDQGEVDETALFHLCNHVRQMGLHLMLTAKNPANAWRFSLPDLVSRLRAASSVEIESPDDNLLRGVMMKLMTDRQLEIDHNTLEYALARIERSLAAVNRFVEQLDQLSLSQQRKVTRHLAAQILNPAG